MKGMVGLLALIALLAGCGADGAPERPDDPRASGGGTGISLSGDARIGVIRRWSK